jgi:hypothetical protein
LDLIDAPSELVQQLIPDKKPPRAPQSVDGAAMGLVALFAKISPWLNHDASGRRRAYCETLQMLPSWQS